MKVHIVCYEDVNAWILGKFALKMQENLERLGIIADISKVTNPEADINHHIIYLNYNSKISSIDTLMVTHIDDSKKLNLLKKQLQFARLGICMSRETMNKLIKLGIPREKLTFINPAHDEIIKPRKILIGITCNVQKDGRKREVFIEKLSGDIDPSLFNFSIMGNGWQEKVNILKSRGFDVEYTSTFNYEKYITLIPTLDYYLYTGQDEGQMGYLDALSAGVKTIVTPQGYHLDAEAGINHPFNTYTELLEIFNEISSSKKKLIKAVEAWTWENYTKKHLEVWRLLLPNHNKDSSSSDNIFLLEQFLNIQKNSGFTALEFNKSKEVWRLRKEYARHIYYKIKSKLF